MEYSKKDLAQRFSVTTQAIDKKLNKLGLREKCHKDTSNRLVIPEEIAEIIANDYGIGLKPSREEVKPDFQSLYLEERQLRMAADKKNDELAAQLTELSSKVVTLLGNEKLLEQATRAKELAPVETEVQPPDFEKQLEDARNEWKHKSFWQRLTCR